MAKLRHSRKTADFKLILLTQFSLKKFSKAQNLSHIDRHLIDGEVGPGYLRTVGEKKPVGPAAVVEVDKIGVLGEIGAINRGVGEMAVMAAIPCSKDAAKHSCLPIIKGQLMIFTGLGDP